MRCILDNGVSYTKDQAESLHEAIENVKKAWQEVKEAIADAIKEIISRIREIVSHYEKQALKNATMHNRRFEPLHNLPVQMGANIYNGPIMGNGPMMGARSRHIRGRI